MSIFNKGDTVKILSDAIFTSNIKVPESLIGIKLYVREIKDNDICTLSKNSPTGRSIGTISTEYLTIYDETKPEFTPYIILTTSEVHTLIKPDVHSTIKEILAKDKLFTIIDEKDGYGRLKNNRGWIDLDLVKKLK